MLVPAGYRILLEMEAVEEKTKGGIILPQQVIERDEFNKEWGTVRAMGNCCYHDFPQPWCGVGDVVAIVAGNGKSVTDPDTEKKYRMINDKDVLCIRHSPRGE